MSRYVVEILGEKNYFGPGGFLFTESFVFLWNAVIPPMVWLWDPWSMIKNHERNQALKQALHKSCYLTQKEANLLMEFPDYM